MKVALTGATGFIGSHILTELQEHGHEVTALVRDDTQADIVAARGATPVVVDLYDRPAVASLLRAQTEPFIRPARVTRPARLWTPQWSTRRSKRCGHRQALPPHQRCVDLRGQHLHHRGVAHRGAGDGVVEGADRTPGTRCPRHAWSRDRVQSRLWGRRRRDSGLLLGSPRDDAGNLIMLGTGEQHWSTVHVADLADFFRRALEDDSARGYYSSATDRTRPLPN